VVNSGNATATYGGIAVTGIFSPTVHLPPEAMRPPAEVDAPTGLNNLPHRPGQFVGRSRDLDRLDTALHTPGTALVQVVHGLGGVGKSTLAAHWAATRPHGYTPVRWITADNPASVQQGLASLATALQPALAKALPVEELAEWGLQWLASHNGWLVILDNVNDPADIAPVIARAPGGRFLITSRLATAWGDAATLVRLDVMDEAETLALFTRITTAAGPRDLEGAADLCAVLGYLPLAIDQVAAYLAQSPLTTPRAYLDLFAQHPAAMFNQGGATTPTERTITRIWDITLDQITTRQPAAADLLRALAWYAPENIPTALADGFTDPPALNAAIGLLSAYNMITPDPNTGTLAVHRLVQALARISDPDDPHRTRDHIDHARKQATSNLYNALPSSLDDPATWLTWRTLLPHIDALADHTDTDTDTDTTACILNDAGGFLTGQGSPILGIKHLQRALTVFERLLGADDPETLNTRHNLAGAYQGAGDLALAIPLFEQNLTDQLRVLGEDHPDTLTTRNDLAVAYHGAGDLARAIPLYEQALADQLRVLGEDHRDTLTTCNNLAVAHQDAGNLALAIPLLEQTLAHRLRVLGEDHPNTLRSRTDLAGTYRDAGDLALAIPLLEQTLAHSLRVLGEDHPNILTTRNSLAATYREAGDLALAIPLFEQTLADSLRVLGADHPNTLRFRNNLAVAHQDAGDLALAIRLFEQNLTDQLRVLGADHPHTLRSRSNLALAYKDAGDLALAIRLFEQNLTDQLRVLGEDHPDTLTTRNDLASAYQEGEPRVTSESDQLDRQLAPDSPASASQGTPAPQRTSEEDAVAAAAQLLKERTRELGSGHPDTLQAWASPAYKRGTAGEPAGAAATQEELLEVCLRVLGPDHPDTLMTMGVLAHWREDAGNYYGAAAAWKKLLAARVRALGPNHPDTITAWDLLASSLQKAGDPEGAAAAVEELIAGRVRLLGREHPDTLSARGHLAYCQGMAGDADAAATAFTQLLEDCLRVLGPDHPDTRVTLEGAAYWQTRANQKAP
jgi:tetratricopeptide (TPR) repeat protein